MAHLLVKSHANIMSLHVLASSPVSDVFISRHVLFCPVLLEYTPKNRVITWTYFICLFCIFNSALIRNSIRYTMTCVRIFRMIRIVKWREGCTKKRSWSVLGCIYYPGMSRDWKANVQSRICRIPSRCPNSYTATFILRLELSHKSVDYFADNCVSMLILGGPRYISRYSDAGMGVRFPALQDTLYSSRRPERLSGSPNHLFSKERRREGGLSAGVKLPGREADHSPLSGADVKIARR